MYQVRFDFADGFRCLYTFLKGGEVYSMVGANDDGSLRLLPSDFGGSSRGLIADRDGSLVIRQVNPYSGSISDHEHHIDGSRPLDWLFERMVPDCPTERKPIAVTVTIRDGEPVAESRGF